MTTQESLLLKGVKKMNSLSFNTTSAGTQFCLQKDEKMFVLETEFSKHSETFFPLLDEFLAKNQITLDDIDVFGVVVGPGSFTGIRIGLSVIKMFAYVKQAKCVAVNALEVLAYNNFTQSKTGEIVCSAINAGAENLYYQLFKKTENSFKPLIKPKLCSFAQFEEIKSKLGKVTFCYYDDKKQGAPHPWLDKFLQNQTANALGECVKKQIETKNFVDFHNIIPLYLRSSQAEKIVFNKFNVLKANKQNVSQILELENIAEDGMAWSETALIQSFENPNFSCFLLKQNEEILGYVSTMNAVDEFEILRIVVKPEARNQGVAQNLLKFLFETAKQNKISSIVLEVNEFNFSAQLLYEKMGFEIVGKRTNYYKEGQDGFVMRKVL